MDILKIAIEATALIVAGTMVGNELAVRVFVHPNLSQLDDRTHTRSAHALAKVFGRVMPMWYASTLILNIVVVFMNRTPWSFSWWMACISAVLFAISIGFTITSLVPINNRISEWNLNSVPSKWREQRQQWDQLHSVRIVLLFIALVLFNVSALFKHAV